MYNDCTRTLLGIIIGLVISVSIIYVVETIEHFEELEYAEAYFFLAASIAYGIVAYWIFKSNSNLPYYVLIAGTIGIIILYAVTRTEAAAEMLGVHSGKIGSMGIVSKTIQVGIIAGAAIKLIQNKLKV